MSYALKLYDTELLKFDVIENLADPVVHILWLDESKKELLPLLDHPAQVIRYQAILQLGAQIDSRNVASLIKALDMPYEKSHHEIMLLLRVTTREEIPDDPQAWKDWYKKLPETSEFKQMQY